MCQVFQKFCTHISAKFTLHFEVIYKSPWAKPCTEVCPLGHIACPSALACTPVLCSAPACTLVLCSAPACTPVLCSAPACTPVLVLCTSLPHGVLCVSLHQSVQTQFSWYILVQPCLNSGSSCAPSLIPSDSTTLMCNLGLSIQYYAMRKSSTFGTIADFDLFKIDSYIHV